MCSRAKAQRSGFGEERTSSEASETRSLRRGEGCEACEDEETCMEFKEQTVNGVCFDTAELLSAAGGVRHGFSTRIGGVSEGIWTSMNLGTTRGDDPAAVRENYRRFCAAVGVNGGKIVMSNQIHSDVVRIVTAADVKADLYAPEGYETDGLLTDLPGVTLVVFAADCIPVLLYDPVRKVAGAVHAGWRGTAAGIARKAAERMKEVYGCKGEDILCAIGPGIGRCCFETHEDVPNAMTGALGSAALPYVESLSGGKFKVDLKGLNAAWIRRAGVAKEHIAVSDACTVCRSGRYWSHRATGGQRGSGASMIMLCE